MPFDSRYVRVRLREWNRGDIVSHKSLLNFSSKQLSYYHIENCSALRRHLCKINTSVFFNSNEGKL